MKIKVKYALGSPKLVGVRIFQWWPDIIFLETTTKKLVRPSYSYSTEEAKGIFELYVHDDDDKNDSAGSTLIEVKGETKEEKTFLIDAELAWRSSSKRTLIVYLVKKRKKLPKLLACWGKI